MATVRELKELLDSMIEDGHGDGEGNNFSPYADYGMMHYVAESTWSGSTYIRELTDDTRNAGFCEEDLADPSDNPVPALILWPTN